MSKHECMVQCECCLGVPNVGFCSECLWPFCRCKVDVTSVSMSSMVVYGEVSTSNGTPTVVDKERR